MALPLVCPLPGRSYSWACPEDCGDAFEGVLALLASADVAACRLVSRSWHREVDLLLQRLAPAAGAEPAAVATAFPYLNHLTLTAAVHPAGQPAGASAAPALPPLGALCHMRRLRSLALRAPAPAGAQLDCRALLPLVALSPLASLELSCLRLRHAAAVQQLSQLTSLHISGGGRLGGWQGSLPALLAPLRRLARLHFSCSTPLLPPALATAEAMLADAEADAAVVATVGVAAPGPAAANAPAGLLEGISQLASLDSLELCCRDAASDAACRQIAALPRLSHLAITRCASFGAASPSVSDAGLAELACHLGRQLTTLVLSGHQGISGEGLRHLARCVVLRTLHLRLGPPGLSWSAAAVDAVCDEGMRSLAALPRLESLHLSGSFALGEAGCAALAARLRGRLTCLQLTDCPSLADPALFKLAPLAPGLRRLSLSGCEGISDIGLAAVLRGASRLSQLELAGCHRNITGVGLQVTGLPRLRHLDLAGCDAITDLEIEALLPAAHSLEHLNLRDCRVSDHACALLAATSPELTWLSLEHCTGVSDAGLRYLSTGLPLLRELRLFGSGVSPQAAARVAQSTSGRRLQLGLQKQCWWVRPVAPQAQATPGAAPAGAPPVAAH